MRNWFKKTFEKKPAGPKTGKEQEKDHTISSLYEIVEDHLKSLDHDQLKGISGDCKGKDGWVWSGAVTLNGDPALIPLATPSS